MSIFRTLARPESRNNGWTAFTDMMQANRVAAGVAVTQDSALGLPVVYRCVALNSETIGALPVDVYEGFPDGSRYSRPKPKWILRPNDAQTWQEFLTQVQMSLETDGNAFALKATLPGGALDSLYVLPPTAVRMERTKVPGIGDTVVYWVQKADGTEKPLAANEVVHIRGLTKPGEVRGLSPIALLRESIGVGLAAQEFAGRWFGDGANLSGVIAAPGNMRPEDADRLQESFRRKHGGLRKSHAIGILTGGATFTPISVNAEESQFIETGRANAATISLAFGIPPNYSSDSEGAKGYVTGVIAGKMMWLQLGLLTRVVRIEAAFSPLLPATQYLKLNLRGFLRGSPDEESAYLSAQLDRGVINRDEWRAVLDMNPLPNGEGQPFLNTLANFPAAGVGGTGTTADADFQSVVDRVEPLGALIRAGFDPAAALELLGLPEVAYLSVQPVTVRPLDASGVQLAPASSDAQQ